MEFKNFIFIILRVLYFQDQLMIFQLCLSQINQEYDIYKLNEKYKKKYY